MYLIIIKSFGKIIRGDILKAFKAYDIRGVYNKDFNGDDVYKIGYFLPELLEARKILVARDVRISSSEIYNRLAEGITDSGADVYYLGLATTPMVYFGTAKYNFNASVQITASHNPPEYNGLKISRTDALPVGYEMGLNKLEKIIETQNPIPAKVKGVIHDFNYQEDYLNFLNKYKSDYSNLNVAIDSSNGMAALLLEKILGDEFIYINNIMDGNFPSHDPNPLIEENVKQLKELVLENNCDLGIIFDGDADRVMFVDENGKFISPDIITAVLARYYYLENNNKNKVVLHDIRTSRAVSEYIEKLGGEVHMWKVGHAYAKLKLRMIDALFGGELAGHYYFKEFYNCDSGILTALIVLQVLKELKESGDKFSSLIDSITKYSFSGEINFRIEEKEKAMIEIKDYFAQYNPDRILDFDGYRIEYSDWWFNIRPSNTEPYLRLVVEAEDDILLNEKFEKIKNILKKYR